MKVKNYFDVYYYLLSTLYFIVCYIMLALILILHVKPLYVFFAIILFIILSLSFYTIYFKNYTITRKKLIIKSGFFKKEINLSDIKKCYITNNKKLSYATSIKRIAIKLEKKEIYISPEKMDDVLRKLIMKGKNDD